MFLLWHHSQAVDAFLKAMGLTAAELAAQPDLADLMTAYHFIPGIVRFKT
jgi:hypothetical protein